MPDRPTATAMSEHKVSIPTAVGSNGDGVTEGNGSIPGFYDALVGKIQDEFGSKLPNGNKDKLAEAASTWKTFAEHPTITGAPARITAPPLVVWRFPEPARLVLPNSCTRPLSPTIERSTGCSTPLDETGYSYLHA
ncbi:hypothetical protein [Nocardia abscessus]|uniref:hypothetical protein n=1 Tax=Nocardia abscessus TaxID=120957 RepID=UPI001E2E408B|nr:hypothetical protein [Nocardia abscessus]